MLLLATDAHSEKIQKNRKMTKQQFVNNNIKVCKVDPAYLGRIYDNITRLKFETKTDCTFYFVLAVANFCNRY
jgi:Sec7-like guanine-nucleotide exchange factor